MYNSLVEAFRAAQDASAEAFARVSMLASQFGAESAIVALPVDHANEYRRFLRRLVASLIDRAGNEFGIAGAPVSIDETRIPVNGYPNIWEALRAGETPDLDRYWRVLTQRYEHRGRALAYRQVAQTLAAALELDEPFAPQQRRTFPGLDVVQYNEYWELRFAAPLGERLLAFVAQHLSEPASESISA